MFKDEILENKRRRAIYNCIKKHPGLHIRELQRNLGMPLASMQYHLNYMTRKSIIIEEKLQHYTCYYVTSLDPDDKKLLAIMRQGRLQEIVMLILVNQKAKYKTIVDDLGLPASTISFYLKLLLDNEVIERTKIGYENIYTLKDSSRIEKMLVSFQSSLLDRIVDKWTKTWLEQHPKDYLETKNDP